MHPFTNPLRQRPGRILQVAAGWVRPVAAVSEGVHGDFGLAGSRRNATATGGQRNRMTLRCGRRFVRLRSRHARDMCRPVYFAPLTSYASMRSGDVALAPTLPTWALRG
ncbi:hypothetical protein CBM2586_B130359 [Cupriavidus phytorum]|uniref:Uncharacterized protein n=1 Tax=Cupriavidus taiwanensis TaxID=164546 RepID=A0A375CIN4_9BURK|nr:hypothetical protein CBM2586_B130359 [Cupriavidus taiwanensis]